MIQFEFDGQIARLRKAYGQQVNEEFITILWRKFGKYDARVFAEAIDFMIEERAQLKISVIAEAVMARGRRFSQPVQPVGTDIKCHICGNDAMIFAKWREGGGKFFIRCSCSWGDNADDRLPQWSPKYARDFEPVRIQSMKPDFSPIRNDPALEHLSDDEYFNHPKFKNFLAAAMASSMDYWAQQKRIAMEFWSQYVAEGLSK